MYLYDFELVFLRFGFALLGLESNPTANQINPDDWKAGWKYQTKDGESRGRTVPL
jgi:hypothetical protein